MSKYIRFIKLFCIILVVVLVVYMTFDVIPLMLYNSNTTGKEDNNAEDIEYCKKIINKKYEIILYGRNEELKKLYNKKYYNLIDNFNETKYNDTLLNDFNNVNITNVYTKINNVYIVKYKVEYVDNSSEIFTIIIKINSEKTKAVIIYDDMFN